MTGPAQAVKKRGEGLGTGPVGGSRTEGAPENPRSAAASAGGRAGRSRGAMKLIILLAVLLLGGGGGLGALLGGQQDSTPAAAVQSASQAQAVQSSQQGQGGGFDVLSLLGGGSVSSGWSGTANTGKLDASVASSAREKRTQLLGGGQDTVTIMVYMCGTDLKSRSGMGTADLQEMLAADLGQNVNLLVYTGGCTGWRNNQVSSGTNQIWQVKDGSLACLEEDLGSVPMTSPAVLTQYIQWCESRYPASRYELILWDHGGGSISGYGYDQKFPQSGSMGLAGIDQALSDAGVAFDFIGFDACLMATAENALMLTRHADYLIASEETEPGVGWYYTDWLTALGKEPSMPTLELGKRIADDFVDTCAKECRGQLTTLSVVDLAELEATVPAPLNRFSKAASQLIAGQQYKTLAEARGHTREFAQSSRIDHVDLVHLSRNLGSTEGDALAEALLSAVKYNRTSANMTDAYGISIYFPYSNAAAVDSAVASYQQLGMDEDYVRCIQQFASLEVSGQAVSGGTGSALPSLLGNLGGMGGSADMISQVLGSFLGGGFGRIAGLDGSNTGFLEESALVQEEAAAYLAENRFAGEALEWSENQAGQPVIALPEEQWALVQSLELNLFYDDGEGFIDLGLDTTFDFDQDGNLLGTCDGTWLAINGQPVAYYHTSTVEDGENYSITGYVPVLHNGQRAELLLAFDNERPYGYVAGVRPVYAQGETATVAKSDASLEPGDTLEFLCDYYSYEGDYQDSYLLGEPIEVGGEPLEISDVPLEGSARATYRFTDIYNQHYWTAPIA